MHWKYPMCCWLCHRAVSTGLSVPTGTRPLVQRMRLAWALGMHQRRACADVPKWHVYHTNMVNLGASPENAVQNRNTTQIRMMHNLIRTEQHSTHLHLIKLTFNEHILYTKMISESQGLHWYNLNLIICTHLNNYTYKQLALSWRWCSNV